MASDLLTKIRGELQQRLDELRPRVLEHERLLAAERSLSDMDGARSTSVRPAKPAARKSRGAVSSTRGRNRRMAVKSRPNRQRAVDRGGQAVLDALEHGSHTVSELVMVSAINAGEIRGSIRRLLAAELIHKVDRDGKTAYARPAGFADQ